MHAMDPAATTHAADRARRAASWLLRPWPPLTLFVLLAALYLASSVVVAGRLAASVQEIALASLFAATPVAAQLVRHIASRRLRALATLAAGCICAAAWTALTMLNFAGRGGDLPDHTRVLLAGAGAACLYLPAIWLGSGGLRLRESRGWVARIDSRWPAAIAAAEGFFWLASAWALLHGWARWKHIDVGAGWGPMSIIVLQVSGVLCALDAVRAVWRSSRVVRWPIAAGAAWLAWWHARIAMFYLAMSGWMH